MEDPRVQAAFAEIEAMEQTNIDRLIAYTETPAPPFEESVRAQLLAKDLKSGGLSDVRIDEVGNVLARRPGRTGVRTVAVVAHIDTVFPAETDVTVRKEGNVYHAPGIGDNTRGLIAMLSLAEVMESQGLTTEDDILFVGSVGEEGLGDLRGVRHLFREGGPRIDSFIAIDGGSVNRLITAGVGSNRYRVTFNGPGGHSYGAFGSAHPHQALADAITRFTAAGREITQTGLKSTFSVGRIGGGTSINSIPFSSWMEVDMRSADTVKLDRLDAALRKALQEALDAENAQRSTNDALTLEITSVGKRPAGRNSENSSLFGFVSAAMREQGLVPNVMASSTDANIPLSLGIPAITMSRGGISRNAHAPNESWENTDAHIAVQTLLLTLLAEANRE
ncbi:M20/M25/M40 family metallo-hydrolase [Parasphingorhabdus sp.]|uniref:M20/M25/M40 family metallo-hydrolase n=1 Tax=Parasphingorhabdus sp. TaxID=2709688 RepID=UPI003263AA69